MSRMRVIYVFVNIGNFGLTSQNPLQRYDYFMIFPNFSVKFYALSAFFLHFPCKT
jgi:hypothetical protein